MSDTVSTPAEASANDYQALDRSMAKAVAWTTVGKWAVQPITWVSSLLVARILNPKDYGIVGMAGVFWSLIMLVSEFGVGQAVITIRSLDKDQIAELNTFSVLLGIAGFIVSCIFAIPLGLFFHSHELPAVVVAISVTCVIQSFQVVPDALLQKALRYKLIAHLDIAKALTQALGTLAMAFLGLGYWTLVGSYIWGALLATTLTLSFCRHSFRRPRFASIGHAIRFSRDVIVSRIGWYVYSNADFMVTGRMLGESALGAYSLAWTTASLPVEKITNMVARVTPAFFSAIQTEKDQLRRYVLRITEALSLLTFPASFGMALTAPEFVRLLLGPKWASAILPLQLLALYISFRSISTFFPNLLNATGHSSFVMWNTIAAALLFPPGFYLASRWGTSGIAIAWVLLYPIITIPQYVRMFRIIGLSASTYVKSLYPAASGSAALVLMVAGVAYLLPPAVQGWARLVVKIVVGTIAYAGTLLLLHRQQMSTYRDILKQLRS